MLNSNREDSCTFVPRIASNREHHSAGPKWRPLVSMFCSKSAARRAADKLNSAFIDDPLPTMVKLELGLSLLLTALHEGPDTQRPEVVAKVLARIVVTPEPPPFAEALPNPPAPPPRMRRRGSIRLH